MHFQKGTSTSGIHYQMVAGSAHECHTAHVPSASRSRRAIALAPYRSRKLVG